MERVLTLDELPALWMKTQNGCGPKTVVSERYSELFWNECGLCLYKNDPVL